MTTPKLFSVVDVETTGFGRNDKICEIAIIKMDADTFDIVDEFNTLINPQRDLGPVHIHQVSASMVSGAPTFEEVASGIVKHLNDAVLVAHNLTFDQRMLAQEFEELYAAFNPGKGVCTLQLTGEKLAVAAKRYGIEYQAHHRAMDDARASAELFKILFEEGEQEIAPLQVAVDNALPCARLVMREEAMKVSKSKALIRQICAYTRFPTSEADILQYLNLLNEILGDLTLNAAEQKQANQLMRALNLTDNDVKWAHDVYLQTLIASAKRDGIITSREKHIMDTVARILDVSPQEIPSVSEGLVCDNYAVGTRVCFTGTAVDRNNQPIARRTLEFEATKKGLQPVASVTKKGCDLVVAQDVTSASGKAKKAHGYGIKIISVHEFLNNLRGN